MNYSRSSKREIILDDFSLGEWQKVIKICCDDAYEYNKPFLTIQLEVIGTAPLPPTKAELRQKAKALEAESNFERAKTLKKMSAGIKGNRPSLFDNLKTFAPKTPVPTRPDTNISDLFTDDDDNEDIIIPKPKPQRKT